MVTLVKFSSLIAIALLSARFLSQNLPIIESYVVTTLICLYIMSFIPLLKRVPNKDMAFKIRIVLDNLSIMYATIRVFGEYSLLYGFIVQILLSLYVNFVYLNNNKRIFTYLGISPIVQICIIIFLGQYALKPMLIYAITAVVISVCVFILSYQSPVKAETTDAAQKFIGDLIKHEIRNCMTAMDYYIGHLDLSKPESREKVKNILLHINEVVNDTIVTDLHSLVWKIVAHLKHKFPGAEVEVEENTKIKPKINMSVLLLSLYVFIENAFEASATTIKVFLKGGYLVIEDNGSGFDTAKISLGYSTKGKSHGAGGRGLFSTIEMLRAQQIVVGVESKPQKGTTISLNLTNFL